MIPERDRIQAVMTTEEIAAEMERGDYSAEMLLQHLIRHHNRLERELEQERQDRKQADLDALRALGGRNDARAEVAVWRHKAKQLEAELAKFDETAIEWWCEYQDLKAKAREP